MKLYAVLFAVIFLILASGCLGEVGSGAELSHIHTADMDPQACDDTSHSETNTTAIAVSTTTISSNAATSTLPRLTTTTLHPSQAGPSRKTHAPTRFTAKVYKDASACRCCDLYFNYFEAYGFELEVIETDDMESLYTEYKIPHHMQSCHTIFIEGYFIEGHPPIAAVEKLLAEKPDIDGITLPGIPNGAPGNIGAKTTEFTIYALKNGEASVFLIL